MRLNRRRMQFSLGSLLVGMTVICLALSWRMSTIREENRFLDAIRTRGGTVHYETARYPNGLNWLADLRRPSDTVVGIEFRGQDITDQDCAGLARFPRIERLAFYGCRFDVTPIGESYLAKLPSVKMTYLVACDPGNLKLPGNVIMD